MIVGVPYFKVVKQIGGLYHRELINPHCTPAARSMENYANEEEAVAGAERARQLIGRASIHRE
jgi:hypothetical protein